MMMFLTNLLLPSLRADPIATHSTADGRLLLRTLPLPNKSQFLTALLTSAITNRLYLAHLDCLRADPIAIHTIVDGRPLLQIPLLLKKTRSPPAQASSAKLRLQLLILFRVNQDLIATPMIADGRLLLLTLLLLKRNLFPPALASSAKPKQQLQIMLKKSLFQHALQLNARLKQQPLIMLRKSPDLTATLTIADGRQLQLTPLSLKRSPSPPAPATSAKRVTCQPMLTTTFKLRFRQTLFALLLDATTQVRKVRLAGQ